MSAQQTKKLLTRAQFANLAIAVTEWITVHGYERYDDVIRLLKHIRVADVYAKPSVQKPEPSVQKPEPSVQEMADAIGEHLAPGSSGQASWQRMLTNPEAVMGAARLLGENISITIKATGYWVKWSDGTFLPCVTLESACTRLVRHLYYTHIAEKPEAS